MQVKDSKSDSPILVRSRDSLLSFSRLLQERLWKTQLQPYAVVPQGLSSRPLDQGGRYQENRITFPRRTLNRQQAPVIVVVQRQLKPVAALFGRCGGLP